MVCLFCGFDSLTALAHFPRLSLSPSPSYIFISSPRPDISFPIHKSKCLHTFSSAACPIHKSPLFLFVYISTAHFYTCFALLAFVPPHLSLHFSLSLVCSLSPCPSPISLSFVLRRVLSPLALSPSLARALALFLSLSLTCWQSLARARSLPSLWVLFTHSPSVLLPRLSLCLNLSI